MQPDIVKVTYFTSHYQHALAMYELQEVELAHLIRDYVTHCMTTFYRSGFGIARVEGFKYDNGRMTMTMDAWKLSSPKGFSRNAYFWSPTDTYASLRELAGMAQWCVDPVFIAEDSPTLIKATNTYDNVKSLPQIKYDTIDYIATMLALGWTVERRRIGGSHPYGFGFTAMLWYVTPPTPVKEKFADRLTQPSFSLEEVVGLYRMICWS